MTAVSVDVDGAPFRIGARVRVVQAIDADVHDVGAFVGSVGIICHLDYTCGCAQHVPDDPMIGVRFPRGTIEEFWREEIEEEQP